LARDRSNDIPKTAEITLQDVQTHSNATVHSELVQVTNYSQSPKKEKALKRLASILSIDVTEKHQATNIPWKRRKNDKKMDDAAKGKNRHGNLNI